MNFVPFLLSFIILTGTAILFCNLLKYNIAEGMFAAVSAAVFLFGFFGSALDTFLSAFVALAALAVAGACTELFLWVQDKKSLFASMKSVYWFSLAAILVFSLVIYRGAHVYVPEELYTWALIPKYMLIRGGMEAGDIPLMGNGSSFFHVFTMYLSTFDEGLLYTSNALLCWTGLLLPFGEIKKENRLRAGLFIVTMYFALYALYYFGTKSLGAELPFACIAGGLGAWILTARLHKKKVFILLLGIMLLVMVKPDMALLFGIMLFLLYVMRLLLFNSRDRLSFLKKPSFRYTTVAAASIVTVAGLVFCYRLTMDEKARMAGTAMELKKNGSLSFMDPGTFLSGIFGKALSYSSTQLHFTFINSLFLSLILVGIIGVLSRKKNRSVLVAGYFSVFALIYLLWSYAHLLGSAGYGAMLLNEQLPVVFSVFSVFVFSAAFGWLCTDQSILSVPIPRYIGSVLMLLFLYSTINRVYLPYTTAFYQVSTAGYSDIYYSDMQINEILSKTSPKEKVYMIDQKGKETSEYAASEARYQMFSQVNDYKKTPWKFTASGAVIGSEINSGITLLKLPSYLEKGKYKYVWIFRTDDYLNTMLPKIFGDEELEVLPEEKESADGTGKNKAAGNTASKTTTAKAKDSGGKKKDGKDNDEDLITTDTMSNGQLYKVVYNEKGKAVKLRFVKNTLTFDNRNTYYLINNISN